MGRLELSHTVDGYVKADKLFGAIFPARILEWAVIPFFRGSSQPRNRTPVSHITGRFLYIVHPQISLFAKLA